MTIRIDRVSGFDSGTAIKVAVKTCTTTNITLSGVQTVNGVSLSVDDRVLVKDQINQTENGVYDVKVGAWTRSVDFDDSASMAKGTLVLVLEGTVGVGDGTLYVLQTPDVVLGTSNLVFEQLIVATDGSGGSLFNFDTPQDYAVTGDGVTDDTANMDSALTVAGSTGVDWHCIPRGVYSLGNLVVSALTRAFVYGGGGSILRRRTGTTNTVTFEDASRLKMSNLAIENQWSTLATNGHALVLIDPEEVTVENGRFSDMGGGSATNGGAGILSYPAVSTNYNRFNKFVDCHFVGTASDKSFGLIIDNAEMNIVYGCSGEDATNWGLEFKNNARSNVMGLSVFENSRYSFGNGFEGVTTSRNNVYGLLASRNSDIGLQLTEAEHNVVSGLNVFANSQPDTFGDGFAYALHLADGADENIAVGVLASGTAIDYPVRIRGSRNYVQIADYSDAADSVTLNNGTLENVIDVLHIGEKAETIKGLIDDQNSPIIKKGPGANVFSCDLTREYFGSIRDGFTWGVDGLTNSYLWDSTTNFRFEGANGLTRIGLGAVETQEAGLSVSTNTTTRIGAMEYVLSGSGHYWRFRVNDTDIFRVDEDKFAPVVDATISIGNSSFNFTQAHVAEYWSGGVPVVKGRKTGWSTATGTATRTTFATSTVTLEQLAERVKALIDDLHASAGHGLIGS